MKMLNDHTLSDKQVLRKVNEALGSNYPSLSSIPLDKLKRAYLILKIVALSLEHNISIFQCSTEDINEYDTDN